LKKIHPKRYHKLTAILTCSCKYSPKENIMKLVSVKGSESDRIKEDDMRGMWHGGGVGWEKRIQGFGGETRRKETALKPYA
jgi:hypothetical protein